MMRDGYTIEFRSGLLGGMTQNFEGPALTLGRASDVDIPILDLFDVDAKYLIEITPLGIITVAALHKSADTRRSVGSLGKPQIIDDTEFCITRLSATASRPAVDLLHDAGIRRRLVPALLLSALCVIVIWAFGSYSAHRARSQRAESFDAAVAATSALGLDGVTFERAGDRAVAVRGVVKRSERQALDAVLLELAAHFDIDSRLIDGDDAKRLIRSLLGPEALAVDYEGKGRFVAHTVTAPELARTTAALLNEELGRYGVRAEMVHVEGPAREISLEDLLRSTISSTVQFSGMQYLVLANQERVYVGDQLAGEYQLMRWSPQGASVSVNGRTLQIALKKEAPR